jgi:hypothetical protein
MSLETETIEPSADKGDRLLIGAVEIALEGFERPITEQQVYRLAEERDPPWPFFRFRNKLAAYQSQLRAEARRRGSLGIRRPE